MLKNHLKIAYRQLFRNKVFSGINILGLSLGMALAILIAVFIKSEFSYDKWMTESENTFRVYRQWEGGGKTIWTPSPLAKKLASDFPEVANAAGFAPMGERLLEYAGNKHYIEETAETDSTFFQVFGMELLHGDIKTALDEPNSMILSANMAEQLFGAINPLGEIITYDGTNEYMITGVLDSKSKKSHVAVDIITRFGDNGNYWTGNNRSTYVRLKPKANVAALENKVTTEVSKLIEKELLSNNYTPKAGDLPKWEMQPMQDIYLRSEGFGFMGGPSGSIRSIYIYGIIALLVLMVAIINYVNLTTARASQRGKEVGVKKVAGAGRGLLTAQFITESVLQASVAAVIALLMAEVCLPFFNNVIERKLQILSGEPIPVIVTLFGLAVFTGLLAGIYPAFIMSAYRPVTALKSNFLKTGDNGLFRKVLVTGQFAVTITLLIVMAFIYRQVNYMMDQDLGFKPEQVMKVTMNSNQTHYKLANLKNRFKNIPGVEEVTTASHFPGRFLPDWSVLIEGRAEGVNPNVIFSDEDFVNSLDIEMMAGRFIADNIAADSISNFVVNQEFLNRYNIEENPIGTRIKFMSDTAYGQIVGVMKDFHFQGLDRKIRPLVMNANHWRGYVGLKLSTENLSETIAAVEQLWGEVEPSHPMRYTFLDEDFAGQYAEQQRFGKTILYATLLTLFIALLGLFGLTAFTVERRTREIGIRKVLGASVAGIVGLLATDFMKLVVFASIIALPLGYFLSSTWLEDFAHRTELVWWVFVGAGLLILVVGFLTVALQSVKAALTNPIQSLRSE